MQNPIHRLRRILQSINCTGEVNIVNRLQCNNLLIIAQSVDCKNMQVKICSINRYVRTTVISLQRANGRGYGYGEL